MTRFGAFPPVAITPVLVLACLAGCGGSDDFQTADVSGTVTLDGAPLPDATVTFVPLPDSDGDVTGPPSSGRTNEDGRYTLRTSKGDSGAVVGRHRVMITTVEDDSVTAEADEEGEEDVSDDVYDTVSTREQVPERYNTRSELTFDVPPDGSDSADFELESG